MRHQVKRKLNKAHNPPVKGLNSLKRVHTLKTKINKTQEEEDTPNVIVSKINRRNIQ